MPLRFDFVDAHGTRRRTRFGQPARTIVAWTVDDVRAAMRQVDAELRAGRHIAGFVGYEAGPAFDAALTVRQDGGELPLMWFGVFEAPLDAESHAVTSDRFTRPSEQTRWTPDIALDEYHQAIARVREAIANGDLYQANYTFRLGGVLDTASLEARYEQLLLEHQAPYSAYLDIGPWSIVSLSPELFFRLRDGQIVTKPMKGTASRGLWPDDDIARAAGLAKSEKDRAENVMIVDLMRNDLGRIAEIGSVTVSSLFDVERYPSVFQMVSTVEARVPGGTALEDIFAALFPAGSITGAPKTSSMALLARLERSARGPYCGAIGFAAPGGDAVFNVAIRTAVVDNASGRATFGIGGGVTWDSTASGEYAEALSKAACLDATPRFELLETMRMDDGQVVRREGHLDRLRESAAHFDFSYDVQRMADALDAHAADHSRGLRRVRMVLARDGEVLVDSRPLEVLPQSPRAIVVADTPVSRTNRFLYHKTTLRGHYEHHRQSHPDAFDVLLWNDDGELTEFTIGNLVVEIDGTRWTPPRQSGLLAGVFRQTLLDGGEIQERLLFRRDLARATNVWRVSSLREWVAVTIVAVAAAQASAGGGTSRTS